MNKQPSIAVTSRSFSKDTYLRTQLLAKYDNVTFNESGSSLRGKELVDFLDGHDMAIVALEPVDDTLLEKLPQLKVISKYGVGYDKIDLNALYRRDILFGWTGGVNRRSVSELALAFTISMLRHLPYAHSEILVDQWRQHVGNQLTGKTFGIAGLGHVGKDLVTLLQPFQCTILAHDQVEDRAFIKKHGITMVDRDTLFCDSDIVSLHLPFDDSTKDFVSASELQLMKNTAILINTARGGLVSETALYAALKSGDIASAALDVFSTEPPENNKLLGLNNFWCSPHLGGSAIEAIHAMGLAAIDNLANAKPAIASNFR